MIGKWERLYSSVFFKTIKVIQRKGRNNLSVYFTEKSYYRVSSLHILDKISAGFCL